MIITIDTIEVATALADENVSFKAHNKIKATVGIDYTIEDVRECAEWKKLYKYYKVVLELNRKIR